MASETAVAPTVNQSRRPDLSVRAARLTAAQRSRIASLGAAARRRSLEAARRIADNFAYAAAVATLRSETRRVTRMRGSVALQAED